MPLITPRTNENTVRMTPQETFSESFAKVNTAKVSQAAPRIDSELLRGMAQQDGKALGEMFDRYAEIMCGIAYRILRDQATSEDVVHAAFLQVWRDAAELHATGTSLAGCLALLTRELALRALQFGSSRTPLTFTPVILPGPVLDLTAAQERLRQAVRELPQPSRCAVEMAFFDGLRPDEIAAVTAGSCSQVSAAIRSSLLRLRKAVEE